tara:strand:+ start:4415 stop:6205 length:1791 start_codon:yes stop_codon:yes gene_type:complete
MADNFFDSLGETGTLSRLLLGRQTSNKNKYAKRKNKLKIAGGILGITDNYFLRNAMQAYENFEKSLLPDREYLKGQFQNRQSWMDSIKQKGGRVKFKTIDETTESGDTEKKFSYEIVDKDRIKENIRKELRDINQAEELARGQSLGVNTLGMISPKKELVDWTEAEVEERFQKLVREGEEYDWENRSEASYLEELEQVLSQAKIDMFSPKNIGTVGKIISLFNFGNKTEQEYKRKLRSHVRNMNEIRTNADRIINVADAGERPQDSYNYNLSKQTIEKLTTAWDEGYAVIQYDDNGNPLYKDLEGFLTHADAKFQTLLATHRSADDDTGENLSNALRFSQSVTEGGLILNTWQRGIVDDKRTSRNKFLTGLTSDDIELLMQNGALSADPRNDDGTINSGVLDIDVLGASPELTDLNDKFKYIYDATRQYRSGVAPTDDLKQRGWVIEWKEVNRRVINGELSRIEASERYEGYEKIESGSPLFQFQTFKDVYFEDFLNMSRENKKARLDTFNREHFGSKTSDDFVLHTESDLASYHAFRQVVEIYRDKWNKEELDEAGQKKELKELLEVLSDENLIDEADFDAYIDTVFEDYTLPIK